MIAYKYIMWPSTEINVQYVDSLSDESYDVKFIDVPNCATFKYDIKEVDLKIIATYSQGENND